MADSGKGYAVCERGVRNNGNAIKDITYYRIRLRNGRCCFNLRTVRADYDRHVTLKGDRP